MIYCMRTRIFFPVNNTDCLLHTNSHGFSSLSRIIEFCLHTEYRRRSRIFFFFSCPELSNFVFTRNIADGHGFSCHELSNFNHTDSPRSITDFLFFFLSRIIETCPWTHWSQGGNYRIFVFHDSPWFSVWLKRNNSQIRKFVTKIIPWYSVILRVTIRKFENSLIRDRERLFRDTPQFSVWLKINSIIRKFVTGNIIPCEKPPVMHY